MNNSKIFITGGTGSFGKKFVSMTLKKYKNCNITIYSRDENKQWHMEQSYKDKNIRFIIGDVRDKERLNETIKGHTLVIHAAATKIVPTAEHNPSECIKTNIDGALNVIDACINNNIKKTIALSTDKACNPVNLYGATKLASDKLFLSANNIEPNKKKFSVLRYGNVIGSRGSIVPFFINQAKYNNHLTITDKKMTRFMISREDAVKMLWEVNTKMFGGEIFVKKLPSMNIVEIARTISPSSKIKIIGIRPGEKIHEQMISSADSYNTYEFDKYFKIVSSTLNNKIKDKIITNGKKVKLGFEYSSEKNKIWMTKDNLKKIIKKENLV